MLEISAFSGGKDCATGLSNFLPEFQMILFKNPIFPSKISQKNVKKVSHLIKENIL